MTTPIRITQPYVVTTPTIGKSARLLEGLASLLDSCIPHDSKKDRKQVIAYLNSIAVSLASADTALFRAAQ